MSLNLSNHTIFIAYQRQEYVRAYLVFCRERFFKRFLQNLFWSTHSIHSQVIDLRKLDATLKYVEQEALWLVDN